MRGDRRCRSDRGSRACLHLVHSVVGRVYVTAPIAFAVPGAVISAAVLSSTADTAGEIRAVAEVTSALILFRDTAQIRPRQIDADRGLVVRLLLVGLPLALVVGYRGKGVFPAMPDAVLAEARVGPFHHSQHC